MKLPLVFAKSHQVLENSLTSTERETFPMSNGTSSARPRPSDFYTTMHGNRDPTEESALRQGNRKQKSKAIFPKSQHPPTNQGQMNGAKCASKRCSFILFPSDTDTEWLPTSHSSLKDPSLLEFSATLVCASPGEVVRNHLLGRLGIRVQLFPVVKLVIDLPVLAQLRIPIIKRISNYVPWKTEKNTTTISVRLF